jgi:hypothetical protein
VADRLRRWRYQFGQWWRGYPDDPERRARIERAQQLLREWRG